MPLDHYVSLGRSGLKVSPLCLGAMTFGEEWGIGTNETESFKIMDSYRQLGGNFIDTANAYSHGHSEIIIGNYLKHHPARRQEMVIATKFFSNMHTGDPNAGGSGRKNIIWACEESLRRLQTDYIDLYWMHCWDYHTPIEETLRTLDDLVKAGKIRHIGFSNTPAWKVTQAQMLSLANHWEPLIALQLEYSLLERSIETEFFPLAKEFGLGITPWSPLRSGLLSGKYQNSDQANQTARRANGMKGLDEASIAIIDNVIAIAKAIDASPAQVALNWACQQPAITAPIIGARTVEQLNDNLLCLDIDLSTEHRSTLSAMSSPRLSYPHTFIDGAAAFRSSGLTINGETAQVNPLALPKGKDTY